MVIEKFNRLELAQKIHASRDDVKCMHTDFGGRGLSGFGDKISLRVHKSGKI